MKRAWNHQQQHEQVAEELILPKAEEFEATEEEEEYVFVAPYQHGHSDYGGEEEPKHNKLLRVEFSTGQEEELVQFFQDHPSFYDQSHPDFKNRAKKERLLEKAAEEMKVTSLQVLTWFKSMRTIYGKLKRKKSGQGAKVLTMRQKWTLNNFAFLEGHRSVRTETHRLGEATGSAEVAPPVEEEETNNSNSDVQWPPSQAINGQASTSAGTRRPKPAGIGRQVDEAILQVASGLSEGSVIANAVQKAVNVSQDPRVAFGHWMSCQARGLSERQWRLFMVDVVTSLHRHYEADSQQQPPPGPQHPQ